MKICWDNLEKIHLDKKGNFKKGSAKVYIKSCLQCGEEFIGYLLNKYCCKRCAGKKRSGENHHMYNKKHTEESKKKISESVSGKNNPFYGKKHTEEDRKKISEKVKTSWENEDYRRRISEIKTGRHFSDETRKKMSESHKGKQGVIRKDSDNPNWKGGYKTKNIPRYDTYAHQIEWVEECRRNKEDINILEVKCAYCGRWFIPSFNNVCNRLQSLNGKYKGENRFYCSESCKKECPIYNKTPETIMREDAIRAGRLNWIELNREVQPELRQLVLKRDNYTCQKCGSTDHLHCHHILPVAVEPIESADVDNCITYCKGCHVQVHQKDGCKYNEMKC